MKILSGLIFIFFASLASATDLSCTAGVNGNDVLLERGPTGTAVLSLVQGEDRLDLFCTETE